MDVAKEVPMCSGRVSNGMVPQDDHAIEAVA